jgi:hypothetical protein
VAFAAPLAPFGHCGEDCIQTERDKPLVICVDSSFFRGLYLHQSP